MTPLLKKAFARASELSNEEQDVLAALILQELESEKRWDETFARSQDWLAQMATEALGEHRAGGVKPLQ